MPSFRGIRQTLRGGAGAGRGDSPYPTPAPAPSPRVDPATGREVVSIGGGVSGPNPVPDTKASRKANSPKAKAKALESVNKEPLRPDDSVFSGPSGFARSRAARSYDRARYAEKHLWEEGSKKKVKDYVSGKTQKEDRKFEKSDRMYERRERRLKG